MAEELKPHHYWREDRITGRMVVITPDEYEQWGKDNQPSEAYRPAFTRAQLPSQGGEAVAWREHSVNYAKGEKCPETIETLQAAWDRDQELINDMRHEIARHKTRINRLEQRRPADQVAEGVVAQLREAFPLFDETGLSETEHHCEWNILKERKRLHAVLDALSASGKGVKL